MTFASTLPGVPDAEPDFRDLLCRLWTQGLDGEERQSTGEVSYGLTSSSGHSVAHSVDLGEHGSSADTFVNAWWICFGGFVEGATGRGSFLGVTSTTDLQRALVGRATVHLGKPSRSQWQLHVRDNLQCV